MNKFFFILSLIFSGVSPSIFLGQNMIFWYNCKKCGAHFSWVFYNNNDCKHCTGCGSSDIVRISKHDLMKKLKIGYTGKWRE